MANNDNKNDIMDYDKILNSLCSCGTGLPWIKDYVVMAYPCEHLYHEKCYNNLVFNEQTNKRQCRFCNAPIDKILSMFDEDIHPQRFADMLSMSYYDDMSNNTPYRFIDSVFDIATVFARLPFISNVTDGKSICENIFSLNNMTIKVYGMENVKKEKNKVFICNHVTHIELIVIYYLLCPGFLASSIVGQSGLLEQIQDVVSLMLFERGDKNRKTNIVDDMRNFVDEKGSICIFPEGIMKHPDALIRFRSGAFHINRPLYAITIRHNDIISDGYINKFLYKISGKGVINMEVHILGPYYPPFDNDKIEFIRTEMAKHGNMVLSRVANRDIVDVKGKKVTV
jgi:1-acyl-sn-glycerol-3-phosphate acyltransferase